MKSYEKCRIYLQMAKTTGSETRKSRYLDMVETLMNEDDAVDVDEYSKSIDEGLKEYMNENDVSRRPISECYTEYLIQCRDIGQTPLTRACFTRQIRIGYGMKSMVRKNKAKEAVRIFVSA